MGCRRHGHYGTCGKCDNANVELVYPSTNDTMNKWEAEPIAIDCTRSLASMMFGSVPCGWKIKITPENKSRVLTYSLCDNKDGGLEKAGMVLEQE